MRSQFDIHPIMKVGSEPILCQRRCCYLAVYQGLEIQYRYKWSRGWRDTPGPSNHEYWSRWGQCIAVTAMPWPIGNALCTRCSDSISVRVAHQPNLVVVCAFTFGWSWKAQKYFGSLLRTVSVTEIESLASRLKSACDAWGKNKSPPQAGTFFEN